MCLLTPVQQARTELQEGGWMWVGVIMMSGFDRKWVGVGGSDSERVGVGWEGWGRHHNLRIGGWNG